MRQEDTITNTPFSELILGQSASLSKTLSEEDIMLFAAMSGDVNPAHLDEQHAASTHLGEVIGHGMWAGALISTILGTVLPGPGTIYLSQQLEFKKPISLHETIIFTVTVKEKKTEKPIVVFDCICINSLGDVVVSGTATVLAPTEKITCHSSNLSNVFLQKYSDYENLMESCKSLVPVVSAIVHPVDDLSLGAVFEAAEQGLIEPILIGPKKKIEKAAEESDLDIKAFKICHVQHSHAAAEYAVELAISKQVQAIHKGKLHTDELLSSVIGAPGLRTERRISHCYYMNVPTYDKPLMVTDAAINITPTLTEKIDICKNAVELWHVLHGNHQSLPKVAILAAVEKITEKMQATIDAACLCKMADRKQIKNAILDGPLSFDLAISKLSVKNKGMQSPVAGSADILLMPDIHSANMVAKQLTFLSHSSAAGIVLGATVPIVLTSRSDSLKARLLSSALAAKIVQARKEGIIK